MNEIGQRETQTLTVRTNQMVFTVPSDQEGVDEILYVDNEDINPSSSEPVNLGGAWAGLIDADALLEAIDRSGRETPPSLPITSLD